MRLLRNPALATLLVCSALVGYSQVSQQWVAKLNVSDTFGEMGTMVRTDQAGNIYACSASRPTDDLGYLTPVTVRKYTPGGTLVWESKVRGYIGARHRPGDFVIDRQGNAFVLFMNLKHDYHCYAVSVVKLSSATGAKLWDVAPLYGAVIRDRASRLVTDSVGDVSLALSEAPMGRSPSRLRVIKLANATGATLWSKLLTRDAPGDDDRVSALATDSSGNIIVAANAWRRLGLFDYANSFATTKLRSSDGALVWFRYTTSDERSYSDPLVQVDSANNVVVAGTNGSKWGEDNYFYVQKLNAAGSLLWARTFTSTPSAPQNYLTDLRIMPSNDIVVSGSGRNSTNTGSYGIAVAQWNASGVREWSNFLSDRRPGPDDWTFRDLGGNGLVGDGSSIYSVGVRNDTVVLSRLSPVNGAASYTVTHDVVTGSYNRVLSAAMSGGSVIIGGYCHGQRGGGGGTTGGGTTGGSTTGGTTGGDGSGNDSEGDDERSFAIKLDGPTGSLVWKKVSSQTISGGYETAGGMVLDANGNAFVTGHSRGNFVLAKYSTTGQRLWLATVTSEWPSRDRDLAGPRVVKDSTGKLLTAWHNGWYTEVAKFDPTNGQRLWMRTLDASSVPSLAVDASGNVFCLGYRRVFKLDATTGSTVWQQPFNGPGENDDARDLAVDGSGNAIVTGTTSFFDLDTLKTLDRFYTVKYAGTNGSVSWSKMLTPEFEGKEMPVGVRLDGSGDALVCGTHQTVDGFSFAVAKYAGTNGSLKWAKYLDSGSRLQLNIAFAVDKAGDCVVTGATFNLGSILSSYTVKLDGANGATVWSATGNPVAGATSGSGLAFDSANNPILTGVGIAPNGVTLFLSKLAATTGLTQYTRQVASGVADPLAIVTPAVGANGAVYLLGTTVSATTNSDWTLVQYK